MSTTLPSLHAMSVEFPIVENHPNRAPFSGVLTLVGVPSDRAPSGARGHRLILPRDAAEKAMPSLLGMAVDYSADWDSHNNQNKFGIITHASIEGQELKVRGFIYARHFPEAMSSLRKVSATGKMGMSYEVAGVGICDMRASVWEITHLTFTGAAILLREKAAYKQTSFQLQEGVADAE